MSIELVSRQLTVLDFDCEARPIAWYAGDFTTKQPTAIAWKLIGSKGKPNVAVIGESDRMSLVLDEERAMIEAFRVAYDQADIVTGHYIAGFDLPLVSSALIRLGAPPLADKLTQDTKRDFVKGHGISYSQENLGQLFELNHPKIPMNTGKWFAANVLLPQGIKLTKQRVVGDVEQHIELRQTMIERGLLAAPRIWTAHSRGQAYSA